MKKTLLLLCVLLIAVGAYADDVKEVPQWFKLAGMLNQSQFRFYETTSNGTNYFFTKAPSSLASNIGFILPSTAGTGVLAVSNSSGTMTMSVSTSLTTDITGNVTGNVTGNLTGNVTTSSLAVGGGTAITKILRASAVIDFTAQTSACEDSTGITVTGAAENDECVVGPPAAAVSAQEIYSCYVSAADTVKVHHCGIGTGADVASGTYSVRVFH